MMAAITTAQKQQQNSGDCVIVNWDVQISINSGSYLLIIIKRACRKTQK